MRASRSWTKVLLLGLTGPALLAQTAPAEDLGDQVTELRAQVAELRAANDQLSTLKDEVQQMRSERGENWLNERRAQEVKALVREVLADSDTRASLQAGAMTAGHNGKSFFLAAEDGSFLMTIAGQVQLRYIANLRDDVEGGTLDDEETGFQIRRTKMEFAGHIGNPKLLYAVQLEVSRSTNSVSADKIIVGYKFSDELSIWAGEDKAPFLREEFTSSKRQLAVERSLANELFTLDKVQGVNITYTPIEMIKLQGMISDGARTADGSGGTDFRGLLTTQDATSKEFSEDSSDYALTGRVDVRLAGDWKQMADFTSFPGEELAIFLGGAVHYEVGETGSTPANDNFLLWTVDGSVEVNGLSVFASFVMGHSDFDSVAGASPSDVDPYAFMIQAAYNIPMGKESLEPFVRYEHIDLDDIGEGRGADGSDRTDKINLITFGANYYFNKHNAKLTVDMVYAMDPLDLNTSTINGTVAVPNFASSGLGLLSDAVDKDGQIAFRAQFQLLF